MRPVIPVWCWKEVGEPGGDLTAPDDPVEPAHPGEGDGRWIPSYATEWIINSGVGHHVNSSCVELLSSAGCQGVFLWNNVAWQYWNITTNSLVWMLLTFPVNKLMCPTQNRSYTHRVGFAFPGRQWSASPAPRTWKPIGACRFEGEGDVTGSLLRDFDWLLARFLCPAVAPGTEHRWPVKEKKEKKRTQEKKSEQQSWT